MLATVVGHTGIVRLFARLIERGCLPHAVLFEGPPGCGRRTLARALAAAVLCPRRQGGDACGTCAHCQQVRASTHPDLIEVPGARDALRGLFVDQMRDIASNAYTSPLLGVAKVLIIPDAERLNKETGNALLKLIEEPPPGMVIILTVTVANGLLGTVRSRTQLFRLHALTSGEVERILIARGMAPVRAAQAALRADVRIDLDADVAEAPIVDLEQILEGPDAACVARIIAALPESIESKDDLESDAAPTLLMYQRSILRNWLTSLSNRTRAGLRSPDQAIAGRTLDRLDRVARALADLGRNLAPRMVLEGLSLPR